MQYTIISEKGIYTQTLHTQRYIYIYVCKGPPRQSMKGDSRI